MVTPSPVGQPGSGPAPFRPFGPACRGLLRGLPQTALFTLLLLVVPTLMTWAIFAIPLPGALWAKWVPMAVPFFVCIWAATLPAIAYGPVWQVCQEVRAHAAGGAFHASGAAAATATKPALQRAVETLRQSYLLFSFALRGRDWTGALSAVRLLDGIEDQAEAKERLVTLQAKPSWSSVWTYVIWYATAWACSYLVAVLVLMLVLQPFVIGPILGAPLPLPWKIAAAASLAMIDLVIFAMIASSFGARVLVAWYREVSR